MNTINSNIYYKIYVQLKQCSFLWLVFGDGPSHDYLLLYYWRGISADLIAYKKKVQIQLNFWVDIELLGYQ